MFILLHEISAQKKPASQEESASLFRWRQRVLLLLQTQREWFHQALDQPQQRGCLYVFLQKYKTNKCSIRHNNLKKTHVCIRNLPFWWFFGLCSCPWYSFEKVVFGQWVCVNAQSHLKLVAAAIACFLTGSRKYFNCRVQKIMITEWDVWKCKNKDRYWKCWIRSS